MNSSNREVSWEVSEKDMVGYYLEYKISVFDRGRTMDCVVGEVVVRVQHPQLLRLQHVLVPCLKFSILITISYTSLEFFLKVLIISLISKILQIWFCCLMLHLSVIRIMQDVIEGLWLHVTEHRLQADHSKKFHFKKTLHGKPRGHFFKCIKMTQF